MHTISRRARLRAAIAVTTAVGLLAGCGDADSTGASSAAATHTAPAAFASAPFASVADLFAALDVAIGAETSVHQEMGNLNPPPPAILDQEYGAAGTDLRFSVDLGPTDADLAAMTDEERAQVPDDAGLAFLFYRVDGLVYVEEGADPVPMDQMTPDSGGAMGWTLNSDVRTDFERLARVASDLSFVADEDLAGVPTRHYRFTVTLAPDSGTNPGFLPSAVSGPKPVDLWIGTDDLPVRLDVRASDPLQVEKDGVPTDVEGTGVARTEYSRWSVPITFDVDNLDWTP